jgi:hypothetical protein
MKSSYYFLYIHLGIPTPRTQPSSPMLILSALISRYIESARTTQKTRVTCQTAYSLVCYSTGYGADHIEYTSSVALYQQSAQTTEENTAYLLLCDVTEHARMCLA